jgi:ABC-2 type transport system permease protein
MPIYACWRPLMREPNAVIAIAGRDLLKFFRDPGRLAAALVFPFLMISLLGGTLQLNLGRSAGFNFIGFTFTGFLGMTLFQSTAQGLTSLMDDRQNDFAQELFVSPVSRYSIVFGKILGESLVAIAQVIPMLALAALLRVPLTPAHVALLLPVALLSCFMGGAFGLLLLNTMSDTRASNQIFGFVFLPQYFLAGLISPINVLPWYLEVLSLLSPMRYVIDLARGVVFAGSSEYSRVVLLSPTTNAAILALMFAVFMVSGTALFVRRETNR